MNVIRVRQNGELTVFAASLFVAVHARAQNDPSYVGLPNYRSRIVIATQGTYRVDETVEEILAQLPSDYAEHYTRYAAEHDVRFGGGPSMPLTCARGDEESSSERLTP